MRGQSLKGSPCETRSAKQGLSYLPGQLELAGTVPSLRASLARQAASPLRPKVAQAACDIGLFGDDAAQLDLVEMFMVDEDSDE